MADPVQNAGDDLAQLTKNPTPTLADDVEEFEEQQNDFQAVYNAGGHFKEQLESIASDWSRENYSEKTKPAEVVKMAEVPDSPEIEPEVEGYLEKVEKGPPLPQGLADDYVQQVGMGLQTQQNVHVTLPMTGEQIQSGLQHKVFESVKWLAAWCLRQLQILNAKSIN